MPFIEDRICQNPECGKTFAAYSINGKYCNKKCRDRAFRLTERTGVRPLIAPARVSPEPTPYGPSIESQTESKIAANNKNLEHCLADPNFPGNIEIIKRDTLEANKLGLFLQEYWRLKREQEKEKVLEEQPHYLETLFPGLKV